MAAAMMTVMNRLGFRVQNPRGFYRGLMTALVIGLFVACFGPRAHADLELQPVSKNKCVAAADDAIAFVTELEQFLGTDARIVYVNAMRLAARDGQLGRKGRVERRHMIQALIDLELVRRALKARDESTAVGKVKRGLRKIWLIKMITPRAVKTLDAFQDASGNYTVETAALLKMRERVSTIRDSKIEPDARLSAEDLAVIDSPGWLKTDISSARWLPETDSQAHVDARLRTPTLPSLDLTAMLLNARSILKQIADSKRSSQPGVVEGRHLLMGAKLGESSVPGSASAATVFETNGLSVSQIKNRIVELDDVPIVGATSKPGESGRTAQGKTDGTATSRAGTETKSGDSVNEKFSPGEALTKFTRRITTAMSDGIGRKAEMDRIRTALASSEMNNVAIVGPRGSGRNTLARMLAKDPSLEVIELDVELLAGGAGIVGQIEKRVKSLEEDLKAAAEEAAKQDKKLVLVIREFESLQGKGASSNNPSDLIQLMEGIFKSKDLRIVATITIENYNKVTAKSDFLRDKVAPIYLGWTTEAETKQILEFHMGRLSAHYNDRISFGNDAESVQKVVDAAYNLGSKYLGGAFPNAAIELLDYAIALKLYENSTPLRKLEEVRSHLADARTAVASIKQSTDRDVGPRSRILFESLTELQATVERLKREEEALVAELDAQSDTVALRRTLLALETEYVAAAKNPLIHRPLEKIHEQIVRVQETITAVEKAEAGGNKVARPSAEIGVPDLIKAIALRKNIPIERISADDDGRLENLEKAISEVVFGQPEVVKAVAREIMTAYHSVHSAGRDAGTKGLRVSFVFLGNSGLGKTYLAEKINEILYGNPENLLALQASQFPTTFSLAGNPAQHEGGKLTDHVNRYPFAIILYDEVMPDRYNGGPPEAMELFKRMGNENVIEDGAGRKINISNVMVIYTTNQAQQVKYQPEVYFDKFKETLLTSELDFARVLSGIRAKPGAGPWAREFEERARRIGRDISDRLSGQSERGRTYANPSPAEREYLLKTFREGITQGLFTFSAAQVKLLEMLELERTIFLNANLNRTGPDRILAFKDLDVDAFRKIIGQRLKSTHNLVKALGIEIEMPDGTINNLARRMSAEGEGARNAAHIIRAELNNQISDLFARGVIRKGDKIVVVATDEGQLLITTHEGAGAARAKVQEAADAWSKKVTENAAKHLKDHLDTEYSFELLFGQDAIREITAQSQRHPGQLNRFFEELDVWVRDRIEDMASTKGNEAFEGSESFTIDFFHGSFKILRVGDTNATTNQRDFWFNW